MYLYKGRGVSIPKFYRQYLIRSQPFEFVVFQNHSIYSAGYIKRNAVPPFSHFMGYRVISGNYSVHAPLQKAYIQHHIHYLLYNAFYYNHI
ncbi:hypothetical protein CLOBOL_03333 [Enterocloster bolteae ATCC BAA-613]|uniref:Uncharacterized protein n=1 Tax=Enterocloster bolteae (strain ATCC BAA-613 / DSM 15670 / CCUG 46953 / JCM 12243 / WAL 16351) TaxID=411902 RepID=A8RSI4_ENTBW|nr:hypothetical protein CLOBOL_03333 [Enterocloster bolteae ATCC BAA-613]